MGGRGLGYYGTYFFCRPMVRPTDKPTTNPIVTRASMTSLYHPPRLAIHSWSLNPSPGPGSGFRSGRVSSLPSLLAGDLVDANGE
jgi:hypothetical protein